MVIFLYFALPLSSSPLPTLSEDVIDTWVQALIQKGLSKTFPKAVAPRDSIDHPIDRGPKRLPKGTPKGFKDRHQMLLRRAPRVEILDQGKAVLHWKTWIPTAPSPVYYGLYPEQQSIERPQWRLMSKTEETEASTQHTAILTLSRVERHYVDIGAFAQKGGVLAYRIEQRDPSSLMSFFIQGRFAYEKKDGVYRAVPCIAHGPWVDQLQPDRVVISFDTDLPTLGSVVVQGAGKVQTYFDPLEQKPSLHHEIWVHDLEPKQTYVYRVGGVDVQSKVGTWGDFSFRTPSESFEPTTFAVMSDSRSALGSPERWMYGSNAALISRFFAHALIMGSELILFPGDLVNGFTTQQTWFEWQLQAWKDATAPVGHYIPIYEGMGNHEYLFVQPRGEARRDASPPYSTEEIFAQAFVNPTNGPKPEAKGLPPYDETVYSFDHNGIHFIMLNSNYWVSSKPGPLGNREGFIMNKQMAWLERDLKRARKTKTPWIFVFSHEPGFPNGGHCGDGMYWRGKIEEVNAMRKHFWRLITQYGVAVVFHGDEHNYSRLWVDDRVESGLKGGAWQIITGGCGAPYYGRDLKVPWHHKVSAFYPQEHYVWVRVKSPTQAELRAVDFWGHVLDRVDIQNPWSESP